MNKNSVIAACLILSLVGNAFLLKMYFDAKHNQVTLEKGIVMNEFIEREKELRNFRAFVSELAADDDERVPISEEQSSLYWLLAFPLESIIMKGTYEIQADYEHYDDYIGFIREFDQEYKAIGNHFKSKLPLMTKEQLADFAFRLDGTYELLMNQALRDWKISRKDKKVDIRFEPRKEILDQVIQELMSIREELEAGG
ncbi:hypothetical protein [Cohnella cholangitidis]|uniref:Uncharacterized protein n=1 Tax=Cohnella cholangitidis TaxID=2598458 RepID=A0A7G5BZF1_9BACL|nr:hypothetical protein [Cohnella cholangitidis]QMV42335.1 hypothetical protein FPL14_14870 [Cohnella cholangitidis]